MSQFDVAGIHRRAADHSEATRRNPSAQPPRLGGAKAFGNKALSFSRAKLVEWALIVIVVLYAASLLVAPLIAIVWGALGEGLSAFASAMTSADAISSLKLTLIMAVGATVINTVFGLCIAWVLVRDNFWGRRI